MEETAYFLHLVVKTSKPVVLTGSMRPSSALSADGPLNIFNAVAIAGDPAAAGRGVLVTLNDQIHSAHDITKTNTTSVDTFMSPFRRTHWDDELRGESIFSWPISEAHHRFGVQR